MAHPQMLVLVIRLTKNKVKDLAIKPMANGLYLHRKKATAYMLIYFLGNIVRMADNIYIYNKLVLRLVAQMEH